MNIGKRTTAFMLIVNSLLIAFGIGKFFYFHETVFKDFSRSVPQLSQLNYMLLFAIPGIFILIIYTGLFWVIRVFKEKKWIRSGLIVFFAAKVLAIILPWIVYRYVKSPSIYEVLLSNRLLLGASIAYMLFTFLFVRHKDIRRFFWYHSLLTIIAYLYIFFGRPLYDDFGYNWLLINQDMILYVPFLATMVLFVEVYNLSCQPNTPEVEVIVPIVPEE